MEPSTSESTASRQALSLRLLVLLDVIGQLNFARARLYWHFRECGDSPDFANLRLIAIIRWWSLRAPLFWAAVSASAMAMEHGAEALSWTLIAFAFNVLFVFALAMTTAAALRLVSIGRSTELERYLLAEREVSEMIDSYIR